MASFSHAQSSPNLMARFLPLATIIGVMFITLSAQPALAAIYHFSVAAPPEACKGERVWFVVNHVDEAFSNTVQYDLVLEFGNQDGVNETTFTGKDLHSTIYSQTGNHYWRAEAWGTSKAQDEGHIMIIDCEEEGSRLHCEVDCYLAVEKQRDDVQIGSADDGEAIISVTVEMHPTDPIAVMAQWGDGATSTQWVQSQNAWIDNCWLLTADQFWCEANVPETTTISMAHGYPMVGSVDASGNRYWEWEALIHTNRPEFTASTQVVSHTC